MQTSFACGLRRGEAVAIYHLSVKTISRAHGRSAVAAAAYRAAGLLLDARTGITHDFTRKSGVAATAIILPANAPEWAADRTQLWNAAEQAERRKNSTVAREFEIALPEELSPAERERLANDFTCELVERHRCAADIAIHAPGKGDDRNHHAHILLTTRRLSRDGLGEKTRELDEKASGLVTEWRERWAELCNERLAAAGHAVRVDHRSLEEQGINRLPTQHLGPFANTLERRGIKTELGNINRARAEKNKSVVAAADELESLRAVKARAETIKNELFKLRREIDTKPKNWTTPLLKIAKSAFEKATVAFEKLVIWRDLQNKISAWRNKHPTRAALRVGDGGLVSLENQQADLGEVDQKAEEKLKAAKSTLDYASGLAHEEWVKKNEADKLKARKLARELGSIDDFDYGHDDAEAEKKADNTPANKEVRDDKETPKTTPEWRPLKQARPGPRFSVGPTNNHTPSNDSNPSP